MNYRQLLWVKSVLTKLLVPNGCKLLTCLLILTQWTGTLNRLVIEKTILFPVALLSPASATLAKLIVLRNSPVRSIVPRLASVLTASTILRGVLMLSPPTMWMTPPNLLTRRDPPRRCLVALVTRMLTPCVPVVRTVLKTIEVELVLARRVTIGTPPCRF